MLALLLLVLQEGRVPIAPAPPSPPAATKPAAQRPQIRLHRDEQDLSDLLDSMGALLGIPVEYTKADVGGTVTLRLPGSLPEEEFIDTVHRALATKGLTTVQSPGSKALSVVKLADAPSLARLEDLAAVSTRAGFAKVLIELGHDRTDAATEAIKLVLSKTGTVTAFKEARRLIVADLAPHVRQALRVAAEIDRSAEERVVVEVAVQRTAPSALAALIERVGQAEKAVFGDRLRGSLLSYPEGRSVLIVAPVMELDRWRGLIDQFDRAEPAITRNYSPRRFALSDVARLLEASVHAPMAPDSNEPWRLVTDPLSGTLAVTTTPARHEEIERLFERLEAVAPSVQRPLRSLAVRHRSARELQGLLQGLLDAGALQGAVDAAPAGSAAAAARPVQGPTGPITSQPPPMRTGELGDDILITVDEPTNRLLVLGPPRLLEQVEALLKDLDVRAPQVLVEALVLSLTESERLEFGAELSKLRFDGDVQARISSVFGLGVPDPGGSFLPAPATSGGASGVVLSPGDWSAMVSALETLQRGRSLTIPRLLVDNNRPATLHSVLQTPYASTNASNTVATTSFGGTQDAGTQIQVTPQITEGDQVYLDYSVSISTFVGTAPSPSLPPPRQETQLKSAATVPDGFVVAVGGLSIESDGKGRSQVPILGSIPLLGELFGTRTIDQSRTRFYVFLRGTVMRSESFEDLKYAGGRVLDEAGLDDGWPRLEPRIIR